MIRPIALAKAPILVHSPQAWTSKIGWPAFSPPGLVFLPDALLEIAQKVVDGWTGQEPTTVPLKAMPLKFPEGATTSLTQQALAAAHATRIRLVLEGVPMSVVQPHESPEEWSALVRENSRLIGLDAEATGRFYAAASEVVRALAYGEIDATLISETGAALDVPSALWLSDAALRYVVTPVGTVGSHRGRMYVAGDSLASYLAEGSQVSEAQSAPSQPSWAMRTNEGITQWLSRQDVLREASERLENGATQRQSYPGALAEMAAEAGFTWKIQSIRTAYRDAGKPIFQ